MIAPWQGIVAVLACLAMVLGFVKLIERALHPHSELLRKCVHVAMGLLAISFPWLFHELWPVLLLAGLGTAILSTIKFIPALHRSVGSVLAVTRPSLGEVAFPIAVGTLAALTWGDPARFSRLFFAIPMLIMTLADTVAALVGLAYGRVKYLTSDGLKSVEGSLAFFTIAFFSVHVPLLLFTDVGRKQTLLIALVIGVLSMLLESVSARGLDNLLIPLGAYAFLKLYLHAAPAALLGRLGATLGLLAFALSWRRRTSLDDSALMACALFGYGAWMLGGVWWLIAPMALFLAHLAMWPRAEARRGHDVFAVAAVTGTALVWLACHVAAVGEGGGFRYLFPYAVGFGAHLAIIAVSHRYPSPQPVRAAHIAVAILGGWVLAMLQLIPVALLGIGVRPIVMGMASALAAVAVAAWLFFKFAPRFYDGKSREGEIHTAGFFIATAVSALATFAPLR